MKKRLVLIALMLFFISFKGYAANKAAKEYKSILNKYGVSFE